MTEEEIAAEKKALEDKIEKLEKEKADAEAEAKKQEEIAKEAEKLVSKQSGEVGETRKALKELEEKNEARDKELAELKEKISEGTGPKGKTGDNDEDEGSQATADKKAEEECVELEGSLSDGEEKKLDIVFESLTVEQRVEFKKNPHLRKEFLLQAKESSPNSPPMSWRSKPTPKENADDHKKLVSDVFKKAKQESSWTPTGRTGDVHKASGREQEAEGSDKREMGPVAKDLLRYADSKK